MNLELTREQVEVAATGAIHGPVTSLDTKLCRDWLKMDEEIKRLKSMASNAAQAAMTYELDARHLRAERDALREQVKELRDALTLIARQYNPASRELVNRIALAALAATSKEEPK